MRPLIFALSVAAGVAFLYLLAKILFYGLMLLAPLALLAATVFGIRRLAGYGYAPYRRGHDYGLGFQPWSGRTNEPLGYTPYRRVDTLDDYRTIAVE
ncbi:MAG: hypothetical protein KDC66_06760 [Phaeodactylibacter sp.]|nr:hypothetical protein [Phaeodactylibacter sp.]MCB9273546.1 hypothetical protein [Lewinellaceae bacterium]